MIRFDRPEREICAVLDCRTTGRPFAEGREFICCKHVALAGEAAIGGHANAAAALTSVRRTCTGGEARLLQAEVREAAAWRRISGLVFAKVARRADQGAAE